MTMTSQSQVAYPSSRVHVPLSPSARNGPPAAVVVRGVSFAFDAGRTDDRYPPLFDQFSCSIDTATTVVIMGASGVGKSTLAALIAGCLGPQAGAVEYGPDVRRPSDIAYVDQQ